MLACLTSCKPFLLAGASKGRRGHEKVWLLYSLLRVKPHRGIVTPPVLCRQAIPQLSNSPVGREAQHSPQQKEGRGVSAGQPKLIVRLWKKLMQLTFAPCTQTGEERSVLTKNSLLLWKEGKCELIKFPFTQFSKSKSLTVVL